MLRLPIPDVFGGPAYPYQNAGAVENKGWELQLGWKDQVRDFGYSLNFNLSDVKNQVTNLGEQILPLGTELEWRDNP